MFELQRLDGNIGSEMVAAAKEQRRKRMQEQCLGEVETVVGLIEVTEERIKEEKRKLDIFRRRLTAIENGEVGIQSTPGNHVLIVYNEDFLNLPL